MTHRGYSDRVNHAFAFAAKYAPATAGKVSGMSGVVRASSVAVILASYGADEPTLVACVLKHLIDETLPDGHERLKRDISRKFGAIVYQIVDEAGEPLCDFRGRERAWKACKLDHLARLAMAHPRAVDICVADAIHVCGSLLAGIRRLGREYVATISAANPEDTFWWYRALNEALLVHPRWGRVEMRAELETLTRLFRAEVGLG